MKTIAGAFVSWGSLTATELNYLQLVGKIQSFQNMDGESMPQAGVAVAD